MPITESFSSSVALFVAGDGARYVIKQPWSTHKAEREADALRALDDHSQVPKLLEQKEHEGETFLLIEGFDGEPWSKTELTAPGLLIDLGRAIAQMHCVQVDSFAGQPTWHELLVYNADRYLAAIGAPDADLASSARVLLDDYLGEVPRSAAASLVHFDLRPGNILVRDDQLVGLIDFEACRGGHPSMDLFKLWQQVEPIRPGSLSLILKGYVEASGMADEWMALHELDRLMQIYSLYHGLGGLSWCYLRNDFSGDFPNINRQLITTAATSL